MSRKLIVVLILGMLLTACSSISKRVGWIGSNASARMNFRYGYFDGVEEKSFNLYTDAPMTLSYEVVVNKGSLSMTLTAPDDTAVWSETFTADTTDSQTIQIEQDGRYHLTVRGEETGGHFEIQWEQ